MGTMALSVGTSGFSYKEWKGPFYPEKLPNRDMLAFYGKHLSAVEINNTFYRLPKKEVVENWAAQVPEGFRFSIKAPRSITHFRRLKDVHEALDIHGDFGAQGALDFVVTLDLLAQLVHVVVSEIDRTPTGIYSGVLEDHSRTGRTNTV